TYRAAKNGNGEATRDLGNFYYGGSYGLLEDKEKALELYKLASERGVKSINAEIGKIYLLGEDTEADYDLAAKYLTVASKELNNYTSQAYLSVCYDYGLGVPKDNIESERWYKHSKELREIEGRRSNFDFNRKKEMESGKNISKDDLLELGDFYYVEANYGNGDYAEAIKWYKLATEQGSNKAMCCLGDMYFYGIGLTQDYTKAIDYYRQAGGECYFELAYCYDRGLGTSQDHDEAVKLYKKTFEYAKANKTPMLLDCYYFGIGTDKNYAEAIKIFDNGGGIGYSSSARDRAGAIYEMGGYGVERDLFKALKYYSVGSDRSGVRPHYDLWACEPRYCKLYRELHSSAERGDVESQYVLASFGQYIYKNFLSLIYRPSYVFEREAKIADERMRWYTEAAKQGNEEAKEALEKLQEERSL
ncbi:sel1 repeat family protein, partial [bacterium]|nr:sel1 repeat family protein [bacterium]